MIRWDIVLFKESKIMKIMLFDGSLVKRNLNKLVLLVLALLFAFHNKLVANEVESVFYKVYQTQKQEIIKGRILDKNTQKGIDGVTVKVKGKSSSTQTNEDGGFEIDAKENDILEISFIGYKNTQYQVKKDKKPILIYLEDASQDLETVVVTGYNVQRKKDLTGAVAVVKVAELKSQPAASAVEALQGKASGVQIVNDGAPGSTPQIRIRGYSTINNNEPLYVIDGVPFEGKMSWLNQQDIETMQVLKDASAASIYGARANNGVVIITTKSGKLGRTNIDLDVYAGTGAPVKSTFPKMMSPQQALDMSNLLYNKNDVWTEYLLAGKMKGKDIKATDTDMSKYNYNLSNPGEFYQITKANLAGTNWFEALTQNAPVQSYQLSANGGSETAKYSFSGGHLDQKGGLIHSGFQRYNVRSNMQFSAFNNRLRFGENLQYGFTKGFGMGVNPNVPGGYQGEGSVLGFAYRIQNVIPVYDEGGNFAGSNGSELGNGQNPVALSYRAKDNVNKSNNLFGNIFGEFDVIKGLTLRSSFGLRYENYTGITLTYPNPEFSEGNFNNGMNEYFGYNEDWTWTNTLTYRPEFGDNHQLTVMIGTEAINNRNRELRGSRNGYFVLNSLDYFYLNAGSSNIGNNGFGANGSMFSLMGKADYVYKDRYIIGATIRRDGSSNFGENNLYGVFPGISGAWRISEESFLKENTLIEDLKFRVGYGVTGNQRITPYEFLSRYSVSLAESSYPINADIKTGIWKSNYPNKDIKWEQVQSLNAGVDFTLLQGVLDGSFEWFNKSTTDMLFRVPLPATAVGRATAPHQNIGEMRNRGIEVSLGYHYGRQGDKPFKVDLSGSFSTYRNTIVSLAPSIKQINYGNFRSMETSILKAGEEFGAFYGYQVVGVIKNESDLKNQPNYAGARLGGLRYADLNGDGKIDPNDRTIIGSPHPDFVYSLNINANYKDFDLSLFFYGSQGNDIFEATRYYTDFGVFKGSKSVRLMNAWSPNNVNSDIPSIVPDGALNEIEVASSTFYIQDGSFLKLKNLQLGYNVNTQKLFKNKGTFHKMRIYAGVTNLLTFTKYEGLDPEISATPSSYSALGVDFGIYPQSRQYYWALV